MAGFTGRSKEEEVILGTCYSCPRTRSETCSLNVYYYRYVAVSSFSSIRRWSMHAYMHAYLCKDIKSCIFKNV